MLACFCLLTPWLLQSVRFQHIGAVVTVLLCTFNHFRDADRATYLLISAWNPTVDGTTHLEGFALAVIEVSYELAP